MSKREANAAGADVDLQLIAVMLDFMYQPSPLGGRLETAGRQGG